jgi:exosortase/archaeosortase family protein
VPGGGRGVLPRPRARFPLEGLAPNVTGCADRTFLTTGWARPVAAAALTVSAVAVVLGQAVVRMGEVHFGGLLAGALVPGAGSLRVAGTEFSLRMGTTLYRFDVATICSVAPYIAGAFLAAAMIMLLARETSPLRMVRLAAIVAVLLIVCNAIRIVVIVGCVRWLGFTTGYDVGHRYVGTILMLGALATGFVILAQPFLENKRRNAHV